MLFDIYGSEDFKIVDTYGSDVFTKTFGYYFSEFFRITFISG